MGGAVLAERSRREDRERELRDEYMRLWEARNASEGNRVLSRSLSLTNSLDVFRGNYAELKGFLNHVATPAVMAHMWAEAHRYRLEYAQREAARLLHNYVVAAFSLENSTQRFVREHYSGTRLVKEYESRVRRDFERAPLHRFLRGLCKHTLHRRLPPIKASTKFKTRDDGGQDFENGFWLNFEKMRGWDGWSSGAREYMESLGDEAKLDYIIDAYEPVVVGFHRWLSERIREEHAAAIEETFELERRMMAADDELRRLEASRGGGHEANRGRPEMPEEPERGLILDSLADPADRADRDALAAPEDVVVSLYESLTFPHGGVPSLDRFRSLFLPNAQIVRVEEDGTYLTDIDGLTRDYHLALSEGSVTAVHEHETVRRSFPLGDVAHVLSFHETRYIENGEEKRSQGMYDLHMVKAGERWAITGMHICAGYGAQLEPTPQGSPASGKEDDRGDAAWNQGRRTREDMKPELHPQAAKNFEEKAQALLAAVAPEPWPEPAEPPTHMFRPGRPFAATFGEGDLSGFKITGKGDALGATTARYFEHEGRRFGLEGEQYQALARLSEDVQRTKAFRELVSSKWVEDTILDWMKAGFGDGAAPALGDYLAERCEEDVSEHELWFPVSNLSVESDLRFGRVVFTTISEEMMNRWEEAAQKAKEEGIAAGRGEEYAAQVDYYIHRKRQELQSLAAATVTVKAEPKRAFEVALRESERAVAALGVYQVAATTMPEVTSYCALLGRENVEEIRHLEVQGGDIRGDSVQGVAKPVLHWHLSDEEVSKNRRSFGFDNVSELLSSGRRSQFQDLLLDALLLYSRSTREKDLSGRLVYVLVALESVLLRNDSEPIQQNVGERMAFLIADTLEKRKAAIRNLKDAYALRSRFVHHGHTIDQLETVRRFLLDAWVLFLELAKSSRKYETREQLIDSLEAMKLS
jgi:hypothetical protein